MSSAGIKPWTRFSFRPRKAFEILPAGRGMRVLDKLSAGDEAHLIGCFAHIDAANGCRTDRFGSRADPAGCFRLHFAGHEILVVVFPDPGFDYLRLCADQAYSSSTMQASGTFTFWSTKRLGKREARDDFRQYGQRGQALSGRFACSSWVLFPTDGKLCLGHAVARSVPEAPSAAAFRGVAESLTNWPCQEGESKRLERFMQSLLQSNQAATAGRAVPWPQIHSEDSHVYLRRNYR